MSDIVDGLRSVSGDTTGIAKAAAHEIERLRARVAELESVRPVAAQDGYTVVPVIPTTDQLLAGARVLLGRNRGQSEDGILTRIYQAMLAAAKQESTP